MQYDRSAHCVYYHRYHIVWATKYRYKVLTGDLALRVRTICRQVCKGERRFYLAWRSVHRPRAYVRVCAPKDRHLQSGTQDERPFVSQYPARVSGDTQAVLGPPVLGPGLLLDNHRGHQSRI